MIDSPVIEIYCDGGSNPKRNQAAGWALAVKPMTGEQWSVYYGYLPPPSTNNIAELTAMINSLKLLWMFSGHGARLIPPAIIYSDSQYTLSSVLDWRAKWEYQGFPEKNVELLKELFTIYDCVCSICKVQLKKVKGHAGIQGNEIADTWAGHAKSDSSFSVNTPRLFTKKVVGVFDQHLQGS